MNNSKIWQAAGIVLCLLAAMTAERGTVLPLVLAGCALVTEWIALDIAREWGEL